MKLNNNLRINEPIEKRVFKNTIIGFLSFILTFLQTVISVPILLHFWGKETYGLWLSLFAGFSLLQTLDLGHQSYVGNKLNLLYHLDKKEFKKVLGSSLIIAYLIGAVQLLIGLCVILSGLIGNFLGAEISAAEAVNIEIALISLIVMWFIFGSPSGIIVRILIPAGMMYESQWLGILMRLSLFMVLLITALLGGEIFAAGILIATIQGFISIFTLLYIKKKMPEFFPWWQVWEWKTAFINFRHSLVLTGIVIGQQLSNNGLILFIAKFFQSSAVPVFTTLRTITNTAASANGIFIQALMPDVVKFHAKGEKEKLLLTLDTNWFITGVLVNIVIVIIIPFVKEIYTFWTNGQLEFNFTLFLCLASGISFLNFGSALSTYLFAINDLRSQMIITLVRVSIVFITGYFLLSSAGFTAIGIGIVLSEITASVFLTLYFVNLQLKKMITSLSLKSILIALIPPVLILLDTIIILLKSYNIFIVSFFSLLVMIIVYYFNWVNLNIEVKDRVKLILKHYIIVKKKIL